MVLKITRPRRNMKKITEREMFAGLFARIELFEQKMNERFDRIEVIIDNQPVLLSQNSKERTPRH